MVPKPTPYLKLLDAHTACKDRSSATMLSLEAKLPFHEALAGGLSHQMVTQAKVKLVQAERGSFSFSKNGKLSTAGNWGKNGPKRAKLGFGVTFPFLGPLWGDFFACLAVGNLFFDHFFPFSIQNQAA